MIEKKEDNIRSESYYPDSNYYLDLDNTHNETSLSEDQISYITKFFIFFRPLDENKSTNFSQST